MLFAMTQILYVDEHLHLIRTILNNAIQGSEDKQNKRKDEEKKKEKLFVFERRSSLFGQLFIVDIVLSH